MNDLPELPPRFQNAFEAAKAKAELEYATRAERFPHHPQFADASLHELILIQKVFFAFCTQARNACREGDWRVARASQAIDAAWPLICDSYFVREHGPHSEDDKSRFRAALWRTVTLDRQWKQHLPELAAVAEGATKSNESSRTNAVPAGNGINGRGAGRNPEFPARASWLAARLHERSWNKHDVERNNGPHHKTVQKILDGRHVREDALLKLAGALSAAPAKLKLPPVGLADIPTD